MQKSDVVSPDVRVVIPKYSGFLTLRELAQFLNLPPETILHWSGWFRERRERADFPRPIRLPRAWVWKISEIKKFLGEEMREHETKRLETLLTSAEVADMAGVSLQGVYLWRRKGWLPYIRLGYSTVRFRQSDVLEFLERRSHGLIAKRGGVKTAEKKEGNELDKEDKKEETLK